MTSLVALYSTCYRDWEKAVNTQLELIEHLTNKSEKDKPIIGIHYWNEWWGLHETIKNISPESPPTCLFHYPLKWTITPETDESVVRGTIEYIIYSTRKALQNAEILHNELYGCDIPDDQPILRMRPDVYINNICDFPSIPTTMDDYYISMRHRYHRPHIPMNAPEAGDLMCLTTKRSLKKLLSLDFTSYDKIFDIYTKQGQYVNIPEQKLHALLQFCNINVVNSEQISLSVARSDCIQPCS